MALQLEGKKSIVAEVNEVAMGALSMVAAEYRGLSVSELTDLRGKARDMGVHVRVVRNTLARRALEKTDFSCMNEALVGPVILMFSQESPGSAARLTKDFAKEHDKLVAKAIALGGELYPGSDIDKIAKLPTKDEALSQLMSVMKAPIEKLVRTMVEPHTKLTRVVAAVRDQKEAQA